MAKYNVDNCWYRAKILSGTSDDKFLVRFIDYGNKAEVSSSDLGGIFDKWVMDAPKLAKKCSLNLPYDYDPSSMRAVEHLKVLAKAGFKILKYEIIMQRNKSFVVKMFNDDGKDVLDELLPLMK